MLASDSSSVSVLRSALLWRSSGPSPFSSASFISASNMALSYDARYVCSDEISYPLPRVIVQMSPSSR